MDFGGNGGFREYIMNRSVLSEKNSGSEDPVDSSRPGVSTDLLKYTTFDRLIGGRKTRKPEAAIGQYVARQLPMVLRENEFDMKQMNKIFAARWVTDQQVAFGTKCNKLMVLDVLTNQMVTIPSLISSSDTYLVDVPCGIHSIAMNPSKTMLATGGSNVNDLAVYQLPTFDPFCVGEKGHRDWIFDIKWLDDEFVVTGSRDSNLALWLIKDDNNPTNEKEEAEQNTGGHKSKRKSPERFQEPYKHIQPQTMRKCRNGDKVRAFALSRDKQELTALSLNGVVHLWDINLFRQQRSYRLRFSKEDVCIARSRDRGVYAVGSQSEITILDSELQRDELIIPAPIRRCGIRSVSFYHDVLVVGTGAGTVHFYDLRAAKFLPTSQNGVTALHCGHGFLRQDETYDAFFVDSHRYPNAVYVHCFDQTGTRLFTGGGPLPAGLWGNYAAIWQ